MAVIRNLVVKITADTTELVKALGTAQSKLEKASAEIGKIGSTLTTSITLPLAAIGTAAVTTASKFEQSMANAGSVSGATGEDFERMTALAREMGKTTVFSASEAADAMYYMASAGYKVEQMADSIAPILNLASATQSELAFTTDTVIATLNQFGLEANQAERVTNVFASAIGNSQATLEKLSTSMGYVGPVAKSLGWSIEETTGALSVLYNSGYDGSTAGTALRKAMSSLLNPTSSAKNVLEKLGVSLESVNPETTSMAEIVDTLGKAGMSAADALEVFGDRGGPGMMALISQGGDAISQMTESITNTNSASEMAARQLDTFQGSLKLLKSQAEEVSITIGNILIPMLSKFMGGYITPLIAKFSSLSDSGKELAIKVAMIAASIGPLLLGVSKALKLFSTFANIAKIALSPFAIKIALIAGAVLLLINVFKSLYNENESFKQSVDSMLESLSPIVELLKGLGVTLMEIFSKVAEIVMPIITAIAEYIIKYIIDVLNILLPIIEKVLQAFTYAFSGISKLLSGDFKGAWEDFKMFFITMWDAISMYFKSAINFMIKGLNGFLNLVGKCINYVVDGLNKIKIDIPDWVPIFGGETWGFNLKSVTMPQIPELASGAVIQPNSEFMAILGDQKSGTNIEAPLDTIVSAFNIANSEVFSKLLNALSKKGGGEITVRFEGLSENAFLDNLTPKVIGKAKNMGLI